jgi:hypothetical protein
MPGEGVPEEGVPDFVDSDAVCPKDAGLTAHPAAIPMIPAMSSRRFVMASSPIFLFVIFMLTYARQKPGRSESSLSSTPPQPPTSVRHAFAVAPFGTPSSPSAAAGRILREIAHLVNLANFNDIGARLAHSTASSRDRT